MTEQTAKTKKIFDGRYEILSIVGRGARSVVYHARHVSSPTTQVALKVLIDQKGKNPSAERLRREALAMVSCRHRYIARLDDFHSVGSLCYLSMEYAPESDLRNFVKRQGGKLTVEQAERFLKQCAEGIAFVHRAGIIHRDIKPENILVMNDKEIRITDFGVALLPGEECSIADLQSGVGTMNYMAPEILEGKPADQRSDLYALGVLFYELIVGKNPFEGAPLARQIDVRRDNNFTSPSSLDPTIPQYLSDLLVQCMSYDPDKRFSSGDELLTNLLNKKSDSFSKEQKSQRAKPMRPKTNNLHKRPRKLNSSKKSNQETEDLFAEFDRLLAEDNASAIDNVPDPIETPEAKAVVQDSPPALSDEVPIDQEPQASADVEQTINQASSPSSVPFIANETAVNTIPEPEETDFDEEDEVEEDFDESPVRNKTPTPRRIRADSGDRKTFILFTVSILLLLGVFLPGLRDSLLGAVNSGINSLAFWKKSYLELPLFEAQALTFPNLPKGVFSGSLKGALPGKTVPISLISFGEDDNIAVLLGVEGWSPVVITPQKVVSHEGEVVGKTLRIASNGILLELTGEIVSGKIVGYFSNLVNGAQGEWAVEPAV